MAKVRSIESLMGDLVYWPALLIYGPLGRGKTAFVTTAGEKGTILDFDRGLKTPMKFKDSMRDTRLKCAVATTEAGLDFYEDNYNLPQKYIAARTWLTSTLAESKTITANIPEMVIIDSFTGLMKACQYNIQANSGHIGQTLTQPEWGVLFNEIQNFLNLWKSIPCIHMMVAHEMIITDASDVTTKRILCEGKKFPDQVSSFFDDVFYCDLERQAGGAADKYVLSARATAAVTARTRTGYTESYDMNKGIWPLMALLGYENIDKKVAAKCLTATTQ